MKKVLFVCAILLGLGLISFIYIAREIAPLALFEQVSTTKAHLERSWENCEKYTAQDTYREIDEEDVFDSLGSASMILDIMHLVIKEQVEMGKGSEVEIMDMVSDLAEIEHMLNDIDNKCRLVPTVT